MNVSVTSIVKAIATVLSAVLLGACGVAPSSGGLSTQLSEPTGAVKIRSEAAVTITEVSLGTVEDSGYRVPARGLIVMASHGVAKAAGSTIEGEIDQFPVIIINHLRAPNCSDDTFAYPCAAGVTERRLDQGMVYLATALAHSGYAVVIPDLGPTWVADDVATTYNQDKLWQKVVDKHITAMEHDWLPAIDSQRLDTATIGMMVHSRAGQIVDSAVELWGEKLQSVFAYAPFYDTYDSHNFSPPPADIPYFAVVSETDADVGVSGNLWLGHYLTTPRDNPAVVATTTGFGHTYINRTLSDLGIDDRIGCDEQDCPTAEEHEKFITTAAQLWFDTTIIGAGSTTKDVPMLAELVDPTATFPSHLAGYPVRWLTATHRMMRGMETTDSKSHTITPASGEPLAVTTITPTDFHPEAGQRSLVCRHISGMSPDDTVTPCPEPGLGVIDIATEVNHITAAWAAVDNAPVSAIAIHLARFGSFPQPAQVTVELSFADGSSWSQQLDPDDPTMGNRYSNTSNGYYVLGTIRLRLPADMAGKLVSTVTVRTTGAPVEVRSVDVVG